ncbi:MAG: penicillin-insensitive murein endopeptidase [Pseudomonadota bacterium]
MRLLSLAAALLCAVPAVANEWGSARLEFGAVDGPSLAVPEAYGSYARGCIAGAVELEETGPTWQAMRLSRNRNWGHPETIDFLKELSVFAATQPGWEGLYIGDISQPRGGPMLTGHRSHQMGLDADIWMLPPDRLNLTYNERQNLSSIPITDDFRTLNENWGDGHFEVIKRAAQDPRIARIFVTAPAKLHMCATETGDRSYLRKIRPWWGHFYHFHIRLHCPEGEAGCRNQAPPPPGDGCDETLAWWVSDDALVPKPRPVRPTNAPAPRGRAPLRLADLPEQCAPILRTQ